MAKLLSETTYFTERLFRVHPKSFVAMLITAPAKVGFQNNFLGTLAYLTPLSICYNNTFISHGCANRHGKVVKFNFCHPTKNDA